MIIPFDIWYIILKFADTETLFTCINLCKKISKICNYVIRNRNDINWWMVRWDKQSEHFIREFQDRAHWYTISWSKKLSESFIREFQLKVDW